MKLTTRKFGQDYWNCDGDLACRQGKQAILHRKLKKMASKVRRQDGKAAIKEQKPD